MVVVVDFLGDWTPYFAAIGFVTFSVFSVSLLWTIWRWLRLIVIAPPSGQNAYLKPLGTWAVVTGATDGIGKGYVKQFAKMGMDVVLISRSPSKLDSVATEIEKTYNVRTKTVVADFSHGHEIYDHIRDQLQGMDIGILVNNVGFGPPVEYYLNIPPQETFKVLRVNLGSMLMMTHLVLPAMVEKRKGVVINISSVTAVVPFPLSSVYSASKLNIWSFTLPEGVYSMTCGIIEGIHGFVHQISSGRIRVKWRNLPVCSTVICCYQYESWLERKFTGI